MKYHAKCDIRYGSWLKPYATANEVAICPECGKYWICVGYVGQGSSEWRPMIRKEIRKFKKQSPTEKVV